MGLEFDLLFGGERADLGVAQGFLVGGRRVIASAFGGVALVVVGDGLAESNEQILGGGRGVMQVMQGMPQGADGVVQAAFPGMGSGGVGGGFRVWEGELLLQGEQFGDGHGQDRPVEFDEESLRLATAQVGSIKGLFKAPKFDFNPPPHLIELRRLVRREWRRLSHTGEQPHVFFSELNLNYPKSPWNVV